MSSHPQLLLEANSRCQAQSSQNSPMKDPLLVIHISADSGGAFSVSATEILPPAKPTTAKLDGADRLDHLADCGNSDVGGGAPADIIQRSSNSIPDPGKKIQTKHSLPSAGNASPAPVSASPLLISEMMHHAALNWLSRTDVRQKNGFLASRKTLLQRQRLTSTDRELGREGWRSWGGWGVAFEDAESLLRLGIKCHQTGESWQEQSPNMASKMPSKSVFEKIMSSKVVSWAGQGAAVRRGEINDSGPLQLGSPR
ncbi:hypothetical protein JHW43_008652 [Diplocarpon mali]|nr:hypothetical protein JHW43_008652 [Diplocarpon mali]